MSAFPRPALAFAVLVAAGVAAGAVDGSATPALQANDTSIRAGRVGLGSFDDTGEFRNVVVTGTPAR